MAEKSNKAKRMLLLREAMYLVQDFLDAEQIIKLNRIFNEVANDT